MMLPSRAPLQFTAPESLGKHSAFIFRNRALDLQQQLVIGIIRDRMVQERDFTAGAPELLQQQHLICIFLGQTVGAEYHNDIHDGVSDSISQRIQCGTIQA